MQLTGRIMAVAIAMFLMLTMAVTLVAVPLASAHDPPWEIPTYAYIEVSPDPIGVGQSAFIIMWIDKVPPTAGGSGGDRWTGYTVKVTAPNGDIETLGPYISDPTSSAYQLFTPDQTGTYTFEFNFPGQVASIYHPETGVIASPEVLASPAGAFVNDTYLGSSTTTMLTVQEDPVEEPPTYPLPTQYWTRPIEGENTAWAAVSSNWLGGSVSPFGGYIVQGYQPNGVAPNSPHIMWTRPLEFGGLVGGTEDYSYTEAMTYYGGLSYESRWYNPIIIQGRLYYEIPRGNDPGGNGYICVDLRTGEEIWLKDFPYISPTAGFGLSTTPSFAQLYAYDSPNQHGVIPSGYLWAASGFGTQTWDAYDPLTGNKLFSMTDVPAGTTTYTDAGEIVRYVLNYNSDDDDFIALWNNTASRDLLLGQTGTNAWQYRPIGKTVNASTAYSWNATLNFDLPAGFTVRFVNNDDVLIGSVGTFGSLYEYGTPDPYTLWAIDLRSGTRGNLKWTKSYNMPSGNLSRTFQTMDPETRVFTVYDKETMAWSGFSMDDGSQLWGPKTYSTSDFTYYGSGGTSSQEWGVAYGNIYWSTNGGELFAIDSSTGNLVWTYNDTYSAHETPWGYYPLSVATVVDGKVYVYTSEHSPDVPPYKGARIRAINATTGEEIWTMLSWALSRWSDYLPIADGYLAYLNMYDGQVYCVGKGPSATAVSIQNDVVSEGSSVLITGTVTDESAGAKSKVESGEFTMVPAVSDESMGSFMEYIYMQKPMPQDAVGVDVLLQTLDPNGNFYDIGTVTTDSAGMYKLLWEPPVPGEYTIIATFQGSESYWPSYAEAAIGVTEASPTPPPEEPLTLPPTDMYIAIATIVIVLAIAIVGIMLFRK